jgi:SAM-dependent methyltransferase
MIPIEAPDGGPKSKLGHSEDYFGEYRDFWWNTDFVGLIAKRLNLAVRRQVLEVGCGNGHWTRTFAPFLGPEAEVVCIDRDRKWSDPNLPWTKILMERGVKLKIQHGDATALPFADNTFDFATCQTVLIHLSDPLLALREMLRVLQPGGLLLCVEPDNFAVRSSETSLSGTQPLEAEAAAFKFALAQHRGRIARGLGNLSLGGRLPGMFTMAGLSDIQVCISDKALPLFPPYSIKEQAATLSAVESWFASGIDFTREEVRKSYLAGGGVDADFEAQWAAETANRSHFIEAVRSKHFDRAGGALMYLVSGIKSG